MVRKKTLRLLLCDYQRTARYYTIYRTFKRWSSDDFATILRLFSIRLLCIYTYNYGYYTTTISRLLVTTIPAGTLRLLLTSISYRAKARKEMRRKPPMVPPRPGRLLTRRQTASRRAWEASRSRRADPVQAETLTRRRWHGLRCAAPSYIPYYNRRMY